jgi:hypothetical protein
MKKREGNIKYLEYVGIALRTLKSCDKQKADMFIKKF